MLIDKTAHTGYPALDKDLLVDIITIEDVRRTQNGNGLSSPVRDAMTRELIVVSLQDTMEYAMKTDDGS
jgi:CBS domain-containing protein